MKVRGSLVPVAILGVSALVLVIWQHQCAQRWRMHEFEQSAKNLVPVMQGFYGKFSRFPRDWDELSVQLKPIRREALERFLADVRGQVRFVQQGTDSCEVVVDSRTYGATTSFVVHDPDPARGKELAEMLLIE